MAVYDQEDGWFPSCFIAKGGKDFATIVRFLARRTLSITNRAFFDKDTDAFDVKPRVQCAQNRQDAKRTV
jgi:hypothetical protein